ncbi:hypothetical protein GDO78_008772 [Eleutherodactylus coqui]|uniref:Uncharacterized protein n=1 Tax=Eleutherodactylus coqui TaxID=57060 RepID=A0A8J6FD88_ELECQ|nr:hypothetical protein GDO78_008772 [Eleutherodactylus coqui]
MIISALLLFAVGSMNSFIYACLALCNVCVDHALHMLGLHVFTTQPSDLMPLTIHFLRHVSLMRPAGSSGRSTLIGYIALCRRL